jgi:hypothetical protein
VLAAAAAKLQEAGGVGMVVGRGLRLQQLLLLPC